jgi:hypothetical protein
MNTKVYPPFIQWLTHFPFSYWLSIELTLICEPARGAHNGFGRRALLLSWTKSCQTVTNPDQVFLNFDSFGDERQLRQKCAASSFVNDDCALSHQPTNQPHYKVFSGVSGRESERASAQCIRDWRSAYIMNKCRATQSKREEGRKEKREIAHIARSECDITTITFTHLTLSEFLWRKIDLETLICTC